jgi:hypothetical protein
MAKVKKVDVQQAVGLVTDADVKVILQSGYQALVTEITENGRVEGTVLYVPGIDYKTLLRG